MILIAYFVIGLVTGIAMVKWPGARNESAVGTLVIGIIGWPVIFLIGGLMVVSKILEWFVYDVLKAEDSPSDSHGV